MEVGNTMIYGWELKEIVGCLVYCITIKDNKVDTLSLIICTSIKEWDTKQFTLVSPPLDDGFVSDFTFGIVGIIDFMPFSS